MTDDSFVENNDTSSTIRDVIAFWFILRQTDVANVRRGMQYIKPYRGTMRHMDEGQHTLIVIIRSLIDAVPIRYPDDYNWVYC